MVGAVRAVMLVATTAVLFAGAWVYAETTIDMVTVWNPGNTSDDAGFGRVDYLYQIGKYEVTAGQYTAFLNAVAATDTYGLYSTQMWSQDLGCKIERSGSAGSYTYHVAFDSANRPVNYVSWADAVRFANWLHNGQPTGTQNLATTEDGAYYLNGATSDTALIAVTRETHARYWVASEDEWYKAAYHKNDGVTRHYFGYPTCSDFEPSNVLIHPDPGNSANFYQDSYTIGSPYWRTAVGTFENSASPYGTYDQGGNVWEWNEAVVGSMRGLRGGSWGANSDTMLSSSRVIGNPTGEGYDIGFRMAGVVEPAILIFYNNSAWDGWNGAADMADDGAIAWNKTALLPGQQATFANYTSSIKGINGLMIDLPALPGTPTVNDFVFRKGNDNAPYGIDPDDPDDDWPWAPDPIIIAVRPGAGPDGADRVTLIWEDGVIRKCWLQVTVLATDATGLARDYVGYVGNAVGDSGNSATDTAVNVVDALGVRANPRTLLRPASIEDPYDFNRDRQVNVQDELIVRANPTTFLTDLNLLDLR